MDLVHKLEILSDAAKYDVSCSSSGSSRKNTPGGIGNAAKSGICHTWSDDGRCISLLKILFTNYCCYDCSYCVNRASNDVPRALFTPEEVAELTINFYRRNYIEGLFLSSAVFKNPNYTMELLLKTVQLVRNQYRFNGYIHIKAIPGADQRLIDETGLLVDRMSINIELPSSESLKLLAPQKTKESILKPMGLIRSGITERKELKKAFKRPPKFVPAGQSTQLIIGASPDRDLHILKLSENLYQKYLLKRVYYSAYVPISNHPNLPALIKPPLLREHRLYQADWLLRFYGFKADELLNHDAPDFSMDYDPKSDWAMRNLALFPVEINFADYEMLLRVPGIGVRSAQRIIAARRSASLNFDHVKKLGIVLKRARFFITCQGKYMGGVRVNENTIRSGLLLGSPRVTSPDVNFEQISMFHALEPQNVLETVHSTISGEL